jgi:hypothetical protein
VNEEAAVELLCCERHHLVSGGAVSAIILVLEGDAVVVGRDQPAVPQLEHKPTWRGHRECAAATSSCLT